jgi:hypothetical protein
MVLTNRGQPELAERSGLRFKGAFASFEFEGPRDFGKIAKYGL